jgi:hypothetical protein
VRSPDEYRPRIEQEQSDVGKSLIVTMVDSRQNFVRCLITTVFSLIQYPLKCNQGELDNRISPSCKQRIRMLWMERHMKWAKCGMKTITAERRSLRRVCKATAITFQRTTDTSTSRLQKENLTQTSPSRLVVDPVEPPALPESYTVRHLLEAYLFS